jgi:hypothetical protein
MKKGQHLRRATERGKYNTVRKSQEKQYQKSKRLLRETMSNCYKTSRRRKKDTVAIKVIAWLGIGIILIVWNIIEWSINILYKVIRNVINDKRRPA